MNDKPILFKGEMVRAILDLLKTHTRRVIKTDFPIESIRHVTENIWEVKHINDDIYHTSLIKSPYQSGQRLWVRETFYETPLGIYYRATEEKPEDGKWKPSIFMPRQSSRIDLLVKNVRVERLQDISEEDAIAEGFKTTFDKNNPVKMTVTNGENFLKMYPLMTARDGFKNIWQDINGNESWDNNPWVWVIEFERVKP
jgi:hypothetical protein